MTITLLKQPEQIQIQSNMIVNNRRKNKRKNMIVRFKEKI